MSMIAIKAAFEPIRVVEYGDIHFTYSTFGLPFAHPIQWLKIDNQTDAVLWYSFDGVSDHIRIVPSGFLVWDIGSNKALGQGLFLPEHTQVHVRYASGSSLTYGDTVMSVSYGSEY